MHLRKWWNPGIKNRHGPITAFRSSAVAEGFLEQTDQTETYCDFGVADVDVVAAAATTVPRIESRWAR